MQSTWKGCKGEGAAVARVAMEGEAVAEAAIAGVAETLFFITISKLAT